VPLQVNQLFYNLISNALKYSRNDLAPIIEISTRFLAEKELLPYDSLNKSIPHCEITIKDNGIGFDPKHAEKIFLIFHRLHGRNHYAGTGIGLALCKTIVEHHHGGIFA